MTQKGRVAPFGDPRIKGCSPLPAAFRSVPRPSSPLSAKASTKCPYALDPKPVRRTQRANPPCALAPSLDFDNSALIFTRWPQHRRRPARARPLQGAQPSAKPPPANGQSHSYPQCQRAEDRDQESEDPPRPASSPQFACPRSSRPPAPGGADRDRTGDLLLAKQALSQLSYGPKTRWQTTGIRTHLIPDPGHPALGGPGKI
jgi:hypothetical protein